MTAIGIDLARRSAHQAVLIDPRTPARSVARRVRTTAASLDSLLEAAGGAEGCTVVLEPTGMSWLPVSAWLIHRGATVVRVDTRRAHEFRKFVRRDVKSDRVDAEALARMPAARPASSRPLVLPDSRRGALDRLVRLRAQLVDERTQDRLRLGAVAETYVPGYGAILGDKALGDAMRVLLRQAFDPRRVVELGVEGLGELSEAEGARCTIGLLNRWHTAASEAWSIWGPLQDAGSCPVDFAVGQIEVDVWLDRIESTNARIKALERHIDASYRELDPDRILETIPGIGPTIAPYILATVGDIGRFSSAKGFVSFCGLAPKKSQSGGSDRGGQRISKAGNRLLRRYLYLAADVARRGDLELAQWYTRKVDVERMHHTAAVIGVANKLARRVYAVLTRAAQGDRAGYQHRDERGAEIDAADSRRIVRDRFPSKARRAADQRGSGATPQSTWQPDDSTRRSDGPRAAAEATSNTSRQHRSGARSDLTALRH